MFLHRIRTDVESLSHLGIPHPFQITHLQYLVGRRRELAHHLLYQLILFIGIIRITVLRYADTLRYIDVAKHDAARNLLRDF